MNINTKIYLVHLKKTFNLKFFIDLLDINNSIIFFFKLCYIIGK